jgi:hypothetical protein
MLNSPDVNMYTKDTEDALVYLTSFNIIIGYSNSILDILRNYHKRKMKIGNGLQL